MNKQRFALIMAGGKGLRMNAQIPKQFLEIAGKPVIMHTIETFFNFDPEISLIVVLPPDQVEYWQQLCKKHAFSIHHRIAPGGETRFHSVKNALDFISTPSLVAVHDAVRPLVSAETISRCFENAEKADAAIPVIELVDSIREITGDKSKTVIRNNFRLVQTPQIFDGELLIEAYNQQYNPLFTDDASVVESAGKKIYLVEGNRENIKITTQMDLTFAEMIMKNKM
jgi:2-C-methyl-D-erythritol 4-phosphate cytidylyltransferase